MNAQSNSILPNAEITLENASTTASDIDESVNAESNCLITVLMPCLNECATIGFCIQQAQKGCRAFLALRCGEKCVEDQFEILVADNGSTDSSVSIALQNGAKVVNVSRRGYGAALRAGIEAAQGKYIIIGDSDGSYDFLEIGNFVLKLEEQYDLVVGNRFRGGIQPGAMPWHHRYFGNPALSGLGRLLFGTACGDWHCGLRAFDRKAFKALKFASSGMEFASEMIVRAAVSKFKIAEIPVRLYPDGRDRPPHLSSLSDGMRHLFLLLTCARQSFVAYFVIGILVALSLKYLFSQTGQTLITVTPHAHDVSDKFVVEGEVKEFTSLVQNGKIPTIVEFQCPCGCLSIYNAQGKKIEEPVSLSPNEFAPFSIHFDTHGRYGRSDYTIPVIVKREDGTLIQRDFIKVAAFLQHGLVPCPSSIQLTTKQPTARLLLCDGLLEPKERLVSASTDESRVTVKWHEAEGTALFGGWELRKRAMIELKVDSFISVNSRKDYSIDLLIQNADKSLHTMSIPMFIDDPVIFAMPTEISMRLSGESEMHSELGIYRSNREERVEISSVPEFCSVTKTRTANGIEYFLVEGTAGTGEIQFLIGDVVVNVPIVVSSK